jgi:hypothetical protein
VSRSFVAMKGTAQVTYCTQDGTPYRTDEYGIAYVLQAHQNEMLARSDALATATAAQLVAAGKSGHGTTKTGENVKDHG